MAQPLWGAKWKKMVQAEVKKAISDILGDEVDMTGMQKVALTNDQKPAPFSLCRPLTASTLKVRGLGGRRRGRNNHRRLRKVTRKHHHSLQRLDVPLPQIFHEIRGGKGWTHKEMFHTVRPGGNHRVTFWTAPLLLIANGDKPQLSPHTKTQRAKSTATERGSSRGILPKPNQKHNGGGPSSRHEPFQWRKPKPTK